MDGVEEGVNLQVPRSICQTLSAPSRAFSKVCYFRKLPTTKSLCRQRPALSARPQALRQEYFQKLSAFKIRDNKQRLSSAAGVICQTASAPSRAFSKVFKRRKVLSRPLNIQPQTNKAAWNLMTLTTGKVRQNLTTQNPAPRYKVHRPERGGRNLTSAPVAANSISNKPLIHHQHRGLLNSPPGPSSRPVREANTTRAPPPRQTLIGRTPPIFTSKTASKPLNPHHHSIAPPSQISPRTTPYTPQHHTHPKQDDPPNHLKHRPRKPPKHPI